MKRDESHEPFDIVVSVDADDADGYEIVGTRQIEDGLYEVILAKAPNAVAGPQSTLSKRARAAAEMKSSALSLNGTNSLSPTVIVAPHHLAEGDDQKHITNGNMNPEIDGTQLDDLTSSSSDHSGNSGIDKIAETELSEVAASSIADTLRVISDSLTPHDEIVEKLPDITPDPLGIDDNAIELDPESAESKSPPIDISTNIASVGTETDAAKSKGSTNDLLPETFVKSNKGEVQSDSFSGRAASKSPKEKTTFTPTTPSLPGPIPDSKSASDRKGLLGRFNRKIDGDDVKPPEVGSVTRSPNSLSRPPIEIDPKTGRPVLNSSRPIVDASHRATSSTSNQVSSNDSGRSSRRSRNKIEDSNDRIERRPTSEFLESLITNGRVTEAQLDTANELRLKNGRTLLEAMSDLDIMPDDEIATSVAAFYDLPLCDLPHEKLELDALDLVPEKIAREHMAFPVSISPQGIFVVFAEPSDRLVGLIAQASGHTVLMAISKVSDVRWAIDSNYHALAGVAELVEEFEADEPRRRVATPTSNSGDQHAENAPIVQVVNRILSQAMRDGASDVHIEPADDIVRVRNRVDGVLKVVLVLPAAMGLGLVSRIKIMADMNIVERRRPQDGKFTAVVDGREIDVRVATVATIWGETCVLRVLDKTRSVLGIDDLGMAPDTHETYSRLIRSPFGMVLCVGPTGSGKTTTLYASLTEISDVSRNVMTIEDPVEYVFPSINQIQTNEQAGLTFATGLKSILRQDSDIVLVGEIRDVETAQIAVQSTLTGHFVLSSLHATDAISALTRFIDMGIESFLIASSVNAIVGQRLVRRTCTACKVPYTPSDEEMAFYSRSGGPAKDVFYHGGGCNFCGHTGYKDRVGVYELLVMTPEMKRLIVGFATEDELRDLAKKQGMRTIQDEAISLISKDLTTSAEVVRSIYSL